MSPTNPFFFFSPSSSSSPSNSFIRKDTGGVQAALGNSVRAVRGIGPKSRRGLLAGNKSAQDLEGFTTSCARYKNRPRPRTARPTLQQFRSLGAERRMLYKWVLALKAEGQRAGEQHLQLKGEAQGLGRPSEIMTSRLGGSASRIRLLREEIAAYKRCCRQWKLAAFSMLQSSQEHREWELARARF